jgi:hypothetical protein
MRLFKRHTAAAFAAAAIVGFGGGAAEAAPISYDITYDPTDVLMDNVGTACTGNVLAGTTSAGSCQTLQFIFDLATTVAGFDASTDALASGSLTLTFRDDTDPGPGVGGSHLESVNISLDGLLTSGSPLAIPNGSAGSSTNFDVLAQLSDGQLTVLLGLPTEGIGNNDFYFASSRLIARGERTEVQEEDPPPTGGVPEPASLLLFGLAATAAALRSRRR